MTQAALRRWLWIAAAAALGLRLLLLGQNGLWHDEVATWNTAVLPWSQIRAVAASHSNSPPLYFWAIHLVMAALGQSEWSLRLLSVVAGALTVPVLGLLVAELTESAPAGALAGVLLAVNPLHLWYSQEGRSYALLTLLCGAALLAAAWAVRTGSGSAWLACTVLLLLGLLTHPVAGAVLPVIWIWVWFAPERLRSLRPLALVSVVIVLTAGLVALSIPAHEHPPDHRGLPLADLAYALYAYLAGFSFGPDIRELQSGGTLQALRAHWFQAGLVALTLAGLALAVARRTVQGRVALLALAFLPPIQILTVSLFSVFPFNVRYALPGVLGVMGLAAAVTATASPTAARAGIAILMGLFLWADIQWFTVPRYWKDDTRGAAAWLSSRLPAGGVVGIEPGYVIETLDFYASRAAPPFRVSRVAPDTAGIPMDSLAALAVTRFHHVPGWQGIERDFVARRAPSESTSAILGYHLFLVRRQ